MKVYLTYLYLCIYIYILFIVNYEFETPVLDSTKITILQLGVVTSHGGAWNSNGVTWKVQTKQYQYIYFKSLLNCSEFSVNLTKLSFPLSLKKKKKIQNAAGSHCENHSKKIKIILLLSLCSSSLTSRIPPCLHVCPWSLMLVQQKVTAQHWDHHSRDGWCRRAELRN